MTLNVADLVKAAVPDAENRNARLESENMNLSSNHRDTNFLSKDFPRSAPKLFVIGENDDFDELTLAEWRAEGFDVEYFSIESCGKEYLQKLQSVSTKKIGFCEKFGIIGKILVNNDKISCTLVYTYSA
jgi:hypothetical protein